MNPKGNEVVEKLTTFELHCTDKCYYNFATLCLVFSQLLIPNTVISVYRLMIDSEYIDQP